jgi:hypothetical protein
MNLRHSTVLNNVDTTCADLPLECKYTGTWSRARATPARVCKLCAIFETTTFKYKKTYDPVL